MGERMNTIGEYIEVALIIKAREKDGEEGALGCVPRDL